jgi:hypothetical protein
MMDDMKGLGIVLVAAAGCLSQPTDPVPSAEGLSCQADSDCGGLVCARAVNYCVTADQVRTVTLRWTSAGGCRATPLLDVSLWGSAPPSWTQESIACSSGSYTIDRVPVWFTRAAVQPHALDSGMVHSIDPASDSAAFSLAY